MEATTRTGERQAKLWGQRSKDWAEVQEPQMRLLYDVVLDAIGVGSGMEHLDVGCGAGLAAAKAAERGARVAGLDATPEFLEVARERVPEGEFQQGDIEEIPFADNRFDTVAGFNAFQFAGDPATAMREAARVAKPGAPIAVVTWARKARLPWRSPAGSKASWTRPAWREARLTTSRRSGATRTSLLRSAASTQRRPQRWRSPRTARSKSTK
jgi:ubiquinone/menaquinone biosynthesis C-methylase UbiE